MPGVEVRRPPVHRVPVWRVGFVGRADPGAALSDRKRHLAESGLGNRHRRKDAIETGGAHTERHIVETFAEGVVGKQGEALGGAFLKRDLQGVVVGVDVEGVFQQTGRRQRGCGNQRCGSRLVEGSEQRIRRARAGIDAARAGIQRIRIEIDGLQVMF